MIRCGDWGEVVAAFVDDHVVAPAQQCQAVDVGGATVCPRGDVVRVEVAGLVTAGEAAGAVPKAQGPALRR